MQELCKAHTDLEVGEGLVLNREGVEVDVRWSAGGAGALVVVAGLEVAERRVERVSVEVRQKIAVEGDLQMAGFGVSFLLDAAKRYVIDMDRRSFIAGGVGLVVCRRALAQFGRHTAVVFTQMIEVGGSSLQIDFTQGEIRLTRAAIVERVRAAATAVTTYYGRFPVSRARLLVIPVAGEDGVVQGTTWGDIDGFPAFLRLRVGEETTADELRADWVITHELVHTALADLPDDQHWLEEGIASYVEPIARVQTGQLDPAKMWADVVAGMVNGEPESGDRGLDHTHTWGRTYWGGALFCLNADIAIHTATANRKGLQDALRAIVTAGATINTETPLARVLQIADEATKTDVLSTMYAKWSVMPVRVDLPGLWQRMGIHVANGRAAFDEAAPLAAARAAITMRRG